jgi:hypothetical protein
VGRTTRAAAGAIGAGLGLGLGLGLLLALAGCCNSGTNHRCDFTPPGTDAGDGGSDGPTLCGTEVCDPGEVCCLTKAPANAACIQPAQFESLGCEKMPLPCFMPSDCPQGMVCCVVFADNGTGGTVNCQPQLQCAAGELSFVACGSADDCPPNRPNCMAIQPTPKGDFSICE